MPENISLYWLAAGLVLIALELVVPAFFLVWFGLSAIVLAAFVFLVPLSLTAQGNRSLSGVLCPPAPTRNNPSHIHQGGAGSDQGDSDQQQVAAA